MIASARRLHGVAAIPIASVVFALSFSLAACSGSSSPTTTASTSGAVGASTPAGSPIPTSPVVGVVTHVDASGLSSVAGFTLRTDDGRVLDFAIGTLENGAQFPPGHLAEHQATAEPVRVSFRVEGSRLVAYRIDDASAAPAASGSPAGSAPAAASGSPAATASAS